VPITKPQQTEIFFRFRQATFYTGTWILDLRDCKSFRLVFRYIQVPFKTGFIVWGCPSLTKKVPVGTSTSHLQGFLQKVGGYDASHATKMHNDVGILMYPVSDRIIMKCSTKILRLNFTCPVCLNPTLLVYLCGPVMVALHVVSSLRYKYIPLCCFQTLAVSVLAVK